MDTLGPVAGGIAGAVAYGLVVDGMVWRPQVIGRRVMQMAFAVVMSILAAVLISTVYLSVTTTNRNLALYLDSTEARLTHIEQIIQNIEIQNSEMMSNSAGSTLSKCSCNVDDEEDDHPERDETMFRDRSEEAQDDATTTKQHKPWRLFNVPDDHVLAVHCEGEKLRVLIRPPSDDSLDQKVADDNGQVCGRTHEAWSWTPSIFDSESYRALFWSRPGEERLMPFAWPMPDMWGRLTAALVEKTWDENPPTVEEKTPPESFTIQVDEVLFYRPTKGRTARLLIAGREDAVHLYYPESTEEGELPGPAVSPLPPLSVLPLTFTDSQHARSQVGFRVPMF